MTSNTHSRERQPGSVSNCYCSRVQPRLPLLIPGACSACMRGGQGHLQGRVGTSYRWSRAPSGGNGHLRQVGKGTCRNERQGDLQGGMGSSDRWASVPAGESGHLRNGFPGGDV